MRVPDLVLFECDRCRTPRYTHMVFAGLLLCAWCWPQRGEAGRAK